MVLELKIPHGPHLADLKPLLHVFISYVMSFIYVGIYWNNHHHMLHVVRSINGKVLWANMHLLFWLSMIPFVTAWMGECDIAETWPVALYGFVLFMNAIAYSILVWVLVRHEGENSLLANALGADFKGKISLFLNACAIALAFVNTYISFAIYVAVACIWFIPDKRIETKMTN